MGGVRLSDNLLCLIAVDECVVPAAGTHVATRVFPRVSTTAAPGVSRATASVGVPTTVGVCARVPTTATVSAAVGGSNELSTAANLAIDLMLPLLGSH